MIRLNNLRFELDYTENDIRKKVSSVLRAEDKAIKSINLFRRSIDARKKDDIHFLCSVDVTLFSNEDKVLRRCKNAVKVKPFEYKINKYAGNTPPIVVGMGPAGLFAALVLAQSGARPIVIERGRDVDRRTNDVNDFWLSGRLQTESNVQFGEGGAGTFSDGKLNTGTKDPRQRKVLDELVAHGAPEEILYNAKPHIGTDMLKITVKNIRKKIIELGGTVMFETKLTGFDSNNGKITSVQIERDGKLESIETESVILAIGHSARDTFEMLYSKKLPIEAKPFSVGARIEHLREKIDKAQYGQFAGNKRLGASSYKMNVHLDNGRGVYTFCMCPGGKVVNASSESGMLVTNGMSEYARNGENSNSALLVGVGPQDFESEHPLAGMYFQRNIEKRAFEVGGGDYSAPVQRVDDFICGIKSTKLGNVTPSVGKMHKLSDINNILPEYVCESMKKGIADMGRRLKGFDDGDAILTAAETRSSSPIRIIRNTETLESVAIKGLYPCGEGAGYAGGIISAAVDGIKCAEKIISKNQ